MPKSVRRKRKKQKKPKTPGVIILNRSILTEDHAKRDTQGAALPRAPRPRGIAQPEVRARAENDPMNWWREQD
jgi:hypothetical protein